MKNLLKLQSEYNKNGSYIQLCLPIETETFIPVNNSVRLLDQVLEELDYSCLYRCYSSSGRKSAISPKSLFKIIVYAYSQGIYSSRKIEEACHINLAFRYLLHGEKVPDHNTISRFRRDRLSSCAEELLSQFILLLYEHQELSFKNVFIDGTKIEANANKYTFVWKKATEKFEARLQVKARALLNRIAPKEHGNRITIEDMQTTLELLNKQMQEKGVVCVYGKGKRKTQEQRDKEELENCLKRQSKYQQYHQLFGNRNSFSKTDPDATFMHMKDDHMRNSQLKPAYNVQLAVESEYIVGVNISQERSDQRTLIPFLNQLEKNYLRRYSNCVCDAGYESEENYHYLKIKNVQPYIKPSNYEYSKTRKFQRDMEFRLSMEYLAEQDAYRCKNQRLLTYRYTRTRKHASGYESRSKVYICEDCSNCPYLGTCYKGKYAKQIQVSEQFDQYRKQILENITSEEGIRLRVNRSIQAEGAFGILKWDFRFQRFLTRGKKNVKTECILLALGFNVNKLHHRIQKNRLGQSLFPIEQKEAS